MKKSVRIKFLTLMTIGLFLILTNSCEKDKINSVRDIDGNVYKTVNIGTQTWMQENLKTTRYSNGDVIGTTTPASLNISSESNPKYQWAYDGNEGNVSVYGRLYTWFAVTDSRNVCPTGWHVPSDADWTTLTDYLTNNGYGYEGSGNDIGKSVAATTNWTLSSTPGTVGDEQASNNMSGFTAVPGGYRYINGGFYYICDVADWWSSTESSSLEAFDRNVPYLYGNVGRSSAPKRIGFAIRCIKD